VFKQPQLSLLSTVCLPDLRAPQNYELRHDEWRLARAANVPRQRNGYDCGIFSLMCADYLSEGFAPDFEQRHIAHFRRRIAACCLAQRLP
jgi:sentrin-specific protease 1